MSGASKMDKQERQWRLSAPPPLGWQLVAADGAVLAPAVAGAVWAWPWAVTAALMILGLVVHAWLSHVAARARGIRSQEQMPPKGSIVVISGFGGLLSGLAIQVRPTYLIPLVLAGIFILVTDPLLRLVWRRKDADERSQNNADLPGRTA
jgi:Flp pilus assembly protein TadB